MLIELLRSGASFKEILIQVLIIGIAFVVVLPIHEFSHAYVAYRLGDESQKQRGRLTLNPLKHLDPMGTLCIFLTGFGWAKPVMVDGSQLRRGRYSMALVSLAGPLSNLLTGFVFCLLYAVIETVASQMVFPSSMALTVVTVLAVLAQTIFALSINLAVFNLIPMPPLDGFGIISPLLPDRARVWLVRYQRVISSIFLILLVVGVLSVPVVWLSGKIQSAFLYICRLLVGVFV